MIHSAYCDNPTLPIADFWKRREQGMVHAHKLRIAIQLLNSEEQRKERERREKLKGKDYKNKDLILAGIYGRNSGNGYFLGNNTVVGYLPPDNFAYLVNQPQQPQHAVAAGGGGGQGTTPIGSLAPGRGGATPVGSLAPGRGNAVAPPGRGATPLGSLAPGPGSPGGVNDFNNNNVPARVFDGPPPASGYGGGPLNVPGGSVSFWSFS